MQYLDVFDNSRLITPISTDGPSWPCRVYFKCEGWERNGKTIFAGKLNLSAKLFAPEAANYGFVLAEQGAGSVGAT